jgi:hypothetical protein
MVSQCFVENWIQGYLIFPQAALGAVTDRELQAGVNDRPSLKPTGVIVITLPEELEGAGGNSSRLFAKASGCLTAYGQSHALHPVAHASTQRDLWAIGSNRLCLKVEEDHAGSGAIWDPVESHLALCRFQAPRLDQEGHSMPMLLPSLVFWEAFVWEGGQAETGIADADILPLIGQHFGCDVDEGTLMFWDHLSRPLAPMHQNKLMDPVGCVPLSHMVLFLSNFLSDDVAHNSCRQAKTLWGKAIVLLEGFCTELVVLYRFSPRDNLESHRFSPQVHRFSPQLNFDALYTKTTPSLNPTGLCG